MNDYIYYYLLAVNILAFVLFGVDKQKARRNKWRIPEKTLILSAVIGGSVGAILGMRFFHHKTRKARFAIGVPVPHILPVIFFSMISVLNQSV